jgi:hypothetical protein
MVLLLWGLLVGLLGSLALLAIAPDHWLIQGFRAVGLRDSMAVFKHGGPLLLGHKAVTGQLYPVGVGDDEGMYVYLPLLSRFFGVADPVSMVRYCYVVLMGITAAVYPVVFYRLTRSLLAGIVAPLMLLMCVRSLMFVDFYWLSAWGMLTLLPLIYLLARDWPRFGLPALIALALVAGWLSSIRSQTGLPIVLAGAIVLLLRHWRWWRVLPALALLVVVYISINTFIFPAIRAHRDHWLDPTALRGGRISTHPLWHALYVGLGYLPNAYGLYFEDSVARARVQREAPGTPYFSNRYEHVIREAYFRMLRKHPIVMLKQYAAKALVTTADTLPYLLLVLLTMPAMLLLGSERRIRRRWVVLTLPAIVIMFLPSMIVIPTQGYEQGLYGVLGLLGILGVCWMLERVEALSHALGGLRPALIALRGAWSTSRREQRGPLWQSVRISCAAILVLLVLFAGAYPVRRAAERWRGHPSGVLIVGVRLDPDLGTGASIGRQANVYATAGDGDATTTPAPVAIDSRAANAVL